MNIVYTFLITIMLFSCSSTEENLTATATNPPIKVLYLTGGWYHNYDTQAKMIKEFIPQHINAVVDVNNDFNSFSNPQIAEKYDCVIMNFCYAKSKDDKIVANLTNIVKEGKSMLVIHGSMHTFRDAGKTTDEWVNFLGIHSRRHDRNKKAGYKVTKISNDPIVKKLPNNWFVKPGELYRIISAKKNLTRLTESYSKEEKKNYITSWYHSLGKGKVYGTTIGHFNSIYKNNNFQKLLCNMVLAATNKLNSQGEAISAYVGHKNAIDFSEIKNMPTPRPPKKKK